MYPRATMRVMVADQFPELALGELRALGLEVDYRPGIGEAALRETIGDAGILVVRSASRRAVYVANCPGKNATAVAELAMALILSLDRRVPDAAAALRAGQFDKREYSKSRGLQGQAIGIAGLGAIGREVLVRARAFGLVAHAWSRTLTPQTAQELGVGFASSLELLPKKRFRVGVDVFDGEPESATGSVNSRLLALPGVYATPHVGASTEQAQMAIAKETVRIVRAFLVEGEVPNVVNVSVVSPARFQLVLRHLDKVGVLANVLSVIKRFEINVEELSNTVFDGAEAACAKIRLGSCPSPACLQEITSFTEVLHVDLVPLPPPGEEGQDQKSSPRSIRP
jgi:D-3-phosphoglycerate dehydrogenase